MELLDNNALERSGVVANCRMNRERQLTGSNGYERELRFHPLDVLRPICVTAGEARWLDLCCGSATALAEAAAIVQAESLPVTIVGVDLVQSSAGTQRKSTACTLLKLLWQIGNRTSNLISSPAFMVCTISETSSG